MTEPTTTKYATQLSNSSENRGVSPQQRLALVQSVSGFSVLLERTHIWTRAEQRPAVPEHSNQCFSLSPLSLKIYFRFDCC